MLNSRNSYSVGKRAAETLCVSYADEDGVESVIVRPGHIYGPTATRSDNRVSSAWAYDVAEGKDIAMKSDGAQIRSYCYCLDCASAILKVLLRGENCQAYNISNPDSVINIRQMAELLAKSAGVQLKMEFPSEEEKKGFNPIVVKSGALYKVQVGAYSKIDNAKNMQKKLKGFGYKSIIVEYISKLMCDNGELPVWLGIISTI